MNRPGGFAADLLQVRQAARQQRHRQGRRGPHLHGLRRLAGYLAEEGYCPGLELRPGTQHSASETPDFLKRLLPRARAVTSLPLLVRVDSGFDGAAIFVAMAEARASGSLDWLTVWTCRWRTSSSCTRVRHPRAVPFRIQDRSGSGAAAFGQVRDQRSGAVSGGAGLQHPARYRPARTVWCATPPSGAASER